MPHASPGHAAEIDRILYWYEFSAVNLTERKATSSVGNMCCLFPGSAWWLLTVNSHGRLHHWQSQIILTGWCVLWPVHISLWRSWGRMDARLTREADPATPTSGWHRAVARSIIRLKSLFQWNSLGRSSRGVIISMLCDKNIQLPLLKHKQHLKRTVWKVN